MLEMQGVRVQGYWEKWLLGPEFRVTLWEHRFIWRPRVYGEVQ